MKRITPFLWFDNNLEEAIDFYSSLFPEAKVHSIGRGPDGQALTADFELAGQLFKGLNGGPTFHFNEAFSLFVECDDQAEVDHYWDALVAGGGEHRVCGWLKDRFGLFWQVIPTRFLELMSTGSPEQVGRLMAAMQTMTKFDVAALEAAFDG